VTAGQLKRRSGPLTVPDMAPSCWNHTVELILCTFSVFCGTSTLDRPKTLSGPASPCSKNHQFSDIDISKGTTNPHILRIPFCWARLPLQSDMFFTSHLLSPHEFMEVAKSRFYTKKSIFRNFYLGKFFTNRYYFLVHLRENTKPSKTAYFSPPESS
jgi:hypothetical protein